MPAVHGCFLSTCLTYRLILPATFLSAPQTWQTSAALTYEWSFTDYLIGRFNISAKHTTEYNTGSDLDPRSGDR